MKTPQIKKIIFAVLCIGIYSLSNNGLFAQSTFSTSGDWNTAANWSPASVPNSTSIDVSIDNNKNPTVSSSGSPFVIGNVSADKTTFTVSSGGQLTLGSQTLFDGGTKKSMTLQNNCTMDIQGALIIYGDLIVNNSLSLQLTGTLIVYGDIVLNNGAQIQVDGTGTLQVGGNLSGGNNTQIQTSGSGTISVAGDLTVGGGSSSISGSAGSISVGGSCSLASGTCPNTVTPVELIFFSGNENDASVKLNWATASEENFDYFEIERAVEGTDFESIGEVKGNRNSSSRINYKFNDQFPELGLNYYRLKSVDLDGSYEYSEVILVKFTSNIQLQVSPNPSSGRFSIRTNLPTTGNLDYVVTNQFGIIVYTGTLSEFNTEVDLSDLTKGVYIVRLVDLPSVKAQRILLK